MKNLVTKKNITLFALASFILSVAIRYFVANDYCDPYWDACLRFVDILMPFYVVSIPMFVLFFLRDEIFRSWLKFIAWWLPLGSLLSIIASGNSSGFIGNLFPTQFFTFTIVVMSIFLFVIKTWELRRADRGNPLAWWVEWTSLVAAFVLSVILSYYIYGLFW